VRHEQVSQDLRELAFDFFYWFSRFEFALKESGFRKSDVVGDKAEPGWDKFIEKFHPSWKQSLAAGKLIAENPRRQIIGVHGLEFRSVGFNAGASDLERAVRLAQTVRNNLFHGGKANDYWDDRERMRRLLSLTIELLDDFACLAGVEEIYRRTY
jgi:hypothetical protein